MNHNCKMCSGKGTVVIGFRNLRTVPCRYCRGKGIVTSKAAIKRRESMKPDVVAQNTATFRAKYPAEIQWLEANAAKSSFAGSVLAFFIKKGELSDKQLGAVQNIVAKATKVQEEKAAAPTAFMFDADGVKQAIEALAHAATTGLRKAKLRIGPYVFTVNADGTRLYIRHKYDGIGWVEGTGESRLYTKHHNESLATIFVDPVAAAIQHGRDTGECACCGRELIDPVSVNHGIGPICIKRFNFTHYFKV